MKIYLSAAVILIYTVIISSIGWAENFDFRKTRWGMSKEEVKASENLRPIYTGTEGFVYDISIGRDSVKLSYYFTQDKLTNGFYSFEAQWCQGTTCINDFLEKKELLIKKYGDPVQERRIWHNNLYKNDSQQWGLAVTLGLLKFISGWETRTTEIYLGLSGKEFKSTLTIAYYSKALYHLTKEELEKEQLDAL